MNAFRKMQQRLQEEGWYVGWNEPCCQSCAWSCLPYEFEDGPFKGEEVDYDKVLFNHSQDCELDLYMEEMECHVCDGEGYVYDEAQGEDDDDECKACGGSGYNQAMLETAYDDDELDRSVDGFVCLTPEASTGSMFCFSGSKEGVENLKAVLPIIEECGCTVHWNGTGDVRPEISWDYSSGE